MECGWWQTVKADLRLHERARNRSRQISGYSAQRPALLITAACGLFTRCWPVIMRRGPGDTGGQALMTGAMLTVHWAPDRFNPDFMTISSEYFMAVSGLAKFPCSLLNIKYGVDNLNFAQISELANYSPADYRSQVFIWNPKYNWLPEKIISVSKY